uniref:Borealin C-terminal domain-containing protein n=1 Tax=Opuntia streptacantha TaxID=393608 RepID=A0A7C8YUA2_OPUST
MAKRRAKRTGNQPSVAHDTDTAAEVKQDKNGGSSTEQELERQIATVKAISDIQVEHLLTGLRLLRSNFTEEQLRIPVLLFFEDNLPNVSVVRDGDEHFELRWKDEDGNLSMYTAANRDIHASLLHRMSIAYPSCSAARQSFGGYQFSAGTIKTSFVGADDLPMGNYMSQESLNNLMLGLPEGLQTPGVNSQRLSIGMTPKTLRLPKPGEMLLSVHGSPLGVYKEDNMEAIHESEEG